MREAINCGNIKRRSVIKFLTMQEKPPKTILSIVYGNTCPAKTMVYKGHSLFKQDRESLEDVPWSGRPIEVITLELIAKVNKVITEDAPRKIK